ncbi:hypothetical protein IWQ61_007537 [Dispira simplex]|nr:hypothetical protein IWQ61_007537 [Dispira simplex]
MDPQLIQAYLTSLNTPGDHATQEQSLLAILTAITTGHGSLLTLVQGLEQALTSEHKEQRAKGIKLLATVLGRLDPVWVPAAAVQFLVNFFCERLSDTTCVPWLVEGLQNLFQSPKFDREHSEQVTRALLENIHVQSFQQTARYNILRLILHLLEKYGLTLRTQYPGLVAGFVQAMDGEKDPRNLMLCFRAFYIVAETFEVNDQAEDMFEVVFCYFPITFRPPPGDTLGITTEDLKLALRKCITATPAFGPYAIDPLLTKLSSSSGTAKLDTLQTLSQCFRVYRIIDIEPHLSELVTSTGDIISQTTDESISAEAQRALTTLFSQLTHAFSPKEALTTEPYPVLRQVLNQFVAQLGDNDLQSAVRTCRILRSVATSSTYNALMVSRHVLSNLLTRADQCETVADKGQVLEILYNFFKGCSPVTPSAATDPGQAEWDSFWRTYTDRIFLFLTSAVATSVSQDQRIALKACSALAAALAVPSLFTLDEKRAAVSVIQDTYYTVNLSLQRLLSDVLIQLAHAEPDAVREVTELYLKNHLPLVTNTDHLDKEVLIPTFTLLQELGAIPALVRSYVQVLVTRLPTQVTEHPVSPSNRWYGEQLLETLRILLGHLVRASPYPSNWVTTWVIPRLLLGAVGPCLDGNSNGAGLPLRSTVQRLIQDGVNPASVDKPLLTAIDTGTGLNRLGECIGLLVAQLPNELQANLVDATFHLFQQGVTTGWTEVVGDTGDVHQTDKSSLPFTPLSFSGTSIIEDAISDSEILQWLIVYRQRSLVVFAAIFCNLRATVPLPVPSPTQFVIQLLNKALEPDSGDLVREALCLCIASWWNKSTPPDYNCLERDLLSPVLVLVQAEISSASAQRAAFTLYGWLAKAVLIRMSNITLCEHMVRQLVDWLAHPVLRCQVAACFATLVEDHPLALTRASHANIKFLFRQRFFSMAVPQLIRGYEQITDLTVSTTFPQDPKAPYLLALSYLIAHVPKQVFMTELPCVLPLLLSSFSLPDSDARATVANTLYMVYMDDSAPLVPHTHSIISALLQLTDTRDTYNVMKVRMSALRCLAILPSCQSYETIHPFKREVIQTLSNAVDDRKRLVRHEAVVCRNRWYSASS